MKTFAEFLGEEVSQKDLNTVTYAPGQDSLINKNVRKRRQDSVAGEAVNPYAVGTAVAKKKTGDKPPLEKKTITLAHKIAKSIKNEQANPCWKGYEMIGMKKKNGKSVPNCVPTKEAAGVPKEYHVVHKAASLTSARAKVAVPGDQPTFHKSEQDAHDHLNKKFKKVRDGVWQDKKDQFYFYKKKGVVKESVEQIDEILSIQGRLKRSRDIKKNKAKLKMGKRRQATRIASKERLQDRAKRHARAALVARITKGIPKGELSMQRRAEIERRLERMKNVQSVIARKLLPQVRKDELLKKRSDKSSGKK